MMFKRLYIQIFLLIGLIFAISPLNVSAHATLTNVTPAPNSNLNQVPDEIVLEFNERLEDSQYYIKLYDAKGKQVATEKARLSDNHQYVSLQLPDLMNGTYFVEYYVLSADGHPVDDRFGFSINVQKSDQTNDGSDTSPSGDINSGTDKDSGTTDGMPSVETPSADTEDSGHQHGGMLYWALQMGYYFVLLLFTGWVFWRHSADLSDIETIYSKWFRRLRLIFFIVVAGYGLARLLTLLSEFSLGNLIDLILHTTVGNAWLALLFLSIVSFILLKRSKWIDFSWIIFILLAEAFYGHAAAFQPLWYSIAFDVIHLGAAAIWVAGLILLFVIKKATGSLLTPFTHQFSNNAFLSIIFLIVSGSLLTLRYVPDLSTLFSTTWGWVLLMKIVLVIIVVIMGTLLRIAMKNSDSSTFGKKLEWDLALMLAILFLVAMLTSFSPTPTDETFISENSTGVSIQQTDY